MSDQIIGQGECSIHGWYEGCRVGADCPGCKKEMTNKPEPPPVPEELKRLKTNFDDLDKAHPKIPTGEIGGEKSMKYYLKVGLAKQEYLTFAANNMTEIIKLMEAGVKWEVFINKIKAGEFTLEIDATQETT